MPLNLLYPTIKSKLVLKQNYKCIKVLILNIKVLILKVRAKHSWVRADSQRTCFSIPVHYFSIIFFYVNKHLTDLFDQVACFPVLHIFWNFGSKTWSWRTSNTASFCCLTYLTLTFEVLESLIISWWVCLISENLKCAVLGVLQDQDWELLIQCSSVNKLNLGFETLHFSRFHFLHLCF